jgi:hypothetical protein
VFLEEDLSGWAQDNILVPYLPVHTLVRLCISHLTNELCGIMSLPGLSTEVLAEQHYLGKRLTLFCRGFLAILIITYLLKIFLVFYGT